MSRRINHYLPFLFSFALLFMLHHTLQGQCNNTSEFGSATIGTTSSIVTITTCIFAGEYSTITGAVSGQTLKFTSSINTDFITIRSGSSGGPIVASGTTPLSVVNTFTGTLYMHVNTTGCGSQSTCRTTTVQCTSCPPPTCTNTSPFGTATINTDGSLATITTCIFAGEYSTISGAVSGQTLNFTSNINTDFITIRSGTSGGPIVASGTSPLSFVNTFTGTLYMHVNTTGCGSQSTCRVTTVQCTSCTPPPAPANDLCANAININCGDALSGTTVNSTVDAVGTCTTTLGTAGGVWYKFTGDGSTVTLSLCSGTAYDSKLAVFSGSCGSLSCVVGNDDFCGLQSQLAFTATSGVSYWVLVTGFSTNTGAFTLSRTCCTPPTVPVLTASANPVCTGGSTTISVTGGSLGSATNWVWYTGSCGGTQVHTGNSFTVSPTASVTYYVRGEGGCPPSGSCSSITLNMESTPPTITCPANTSVPVNASCQGTLGNYIASTSASDNCPGISAITQTPASGTTITGNTTVTMSVTDAASLTRTCTFQVAVNDVTAPNITCPATQTQAANASCVAPMANYTALATATDNCTLPSGAVTQSPAAGTNRPLGTTVVTLTATDGAGLTKTCTFNVQVTDQTPPTLTCPVAQQLVLNASCQGTLGSYAALASSSDNCSAVTITQSPVSGTAVSGTGSNLVTLTAADVAGNTASCSFVVNRVDNTLPTLMCPTPAPYSLNASCNISLADLRAQATSSDNCSGVALTQVPAPGTIISGVGTTTVTLTATDASANTKTCTITVVTQDNTLPSMTCPANVVRNNDLYTCSSSSSAPFGTPVTSDNCGVQSVTNNAPADFPVGSTQVTWTVTDNSGNTKSCIQTVTILDAQEPIVYCPATQTSQNDEGDCRTSVDYEATATDNCPGVAVSYSIDPGSYFDIGQTLVTAYATDGGGNTASCNFWVVVNPRPEICNGIDDNCNGFIDENDDWHSVAKLWEPNAQSNELMGGSVAIHGPWAIAGSRDDQSGIATLYARTDNGWQHITALQPLDSINGDQYGASVAIYERFAAVGAPGDDEKGTDAGAVYLFEKNALDSTVWTFLAKIYASDATAADHFGNALSMYKNELLVGGAANDGSAPNTGAAYLFTYTTAWNETKILTATNADGDDAFGTSVGLQHDRIIIGATGDDDRGENAGAAYIFGRNVGGTSNWGLEGKVTGNSTVAGDNFGCSVSVGGNLAIVGANLFDGAAANTGTAYFFNHDNSTWVQEARVFNYNGQANEQYGGSVALQGEYAVVGNRFDSPKGYHSGAAFVYHRAAGGWNFSGELVDPTGQLLDEMGSAVGFYGHTIILGAPGADYSASNTNAGAVHFFEGLCNPAVSNKQQDAVAGIDQISTVKGFTCYPVPFSDVLNIKMQLDTDSDDLSLSVYDGMGQLVSQVHRGAVPAGECNFRWDAGNSPTGIYFVKVISGGTIQSRVVTLVKE